MNNDSSAASLAGGPAHFAATVYIEKARKGETESSALFKAERSHFEIQHLYNCWKHLQVSSYMITNIMYYNIYTYMCRLMYSMMGRVLAMMPSLYKKAPQAGVNTLQDISLSLQNSSLSL